MRRDPSAVGLFASAVALVLVAGGLLTCGNAARGAVNAYPWERPRWGSCAPGDQRDCRAEILAARCQIVAWSPNGRYAVAARCADEYAAATEFRVSREIHLDHLYPAARAWHARTWRHENGVICRRSIGCSGFAKFYNFAGNLVITSPAANQAKGEKGPGDWCPASRGALPGPRAAVAGDRGALAVAGDGAGQHGADRMGSRRLSAGRREVTPAAEALIEIAKLALALGQTNRITRHPDGTLESVATHTVGLAWAACSLAGLWPEWLDQGLVALAAIVHDAPEAVCRDTPTLRISAKERAAKAEREDAAIDSITINFSKPFCTWALWLPWEIKKYEAAKSGKPWPPAAEIARFGVQKTVATLKLQGVTLGADTLEAALRALAAMDEVVAS